MELLKYVLYIMANSLFCDGDSIILSETLLSIGILIAVTLIFLISLKVFSERTKIKPYLYVIISAVLALGLPTAAIFIVGLAI